MAKPAGLILACLVFLLSAAISSPAQTFTTLANFDGTNGASPSGLLVQGTDGNFYGTTAHGGATTNCPNGAVGCGTIFEITPEGTLTTLQSFNGTNGELPLAGLILGTNGTLYGTTNDLSGTFFSIIPGGTLDTLYTFCSLPNCADGSYPAGALIQGTDGNFYGTTNSNAEPDYCNGSCGTVFEITPEGVLTTLYTFNGPGLSGTSVGYAPSTGVVQGTDGNFYGTTAYGGNDSCGLGSPLYCGTIFKLTPQGVLTNLYNFCSQASCADGFLPTGLVQGTDGNFYGTTNYGGGNSACDGVIYAPFYGCGTIFKITPEGTFTTLHNFEATDGARPYSGMILGSDGNFYGTTVEGGANGVGTIFKATSAGVVTTLYSFTESAEVFPNGLLIAANGTFYGTTDGSGTNGDGTVFSFAIGLGGTDASSTSLTLSPSSITTGSSGPVIMTATVAPASGSGTPTGVVNFLNGSSQLATASLSGGVATYNYNPSALAIGTYPITAIYSGDGTFATSTSPAETLTISSFPAAAMPSFSPSAGTYTSSQTVTISDTTSGATIYYTNDGSTPTIDSEVYNGPITVNSTETIKAIAAAPNYLSSAVASATYTITLTPGYQLSVNPSTLTIVAGQSGTAKFTVTPMNGFDSQVTFACSGLPSEATCTFNPASVTPDGVDPITSTVTVNTTAASAASRGPKPSSQYPIYAFMILGFGLLPGFAGRRKSMHSGLRVFSMLALLVLAAGLTSCGSGSNGGSGKTGPPVGGTPVGTSAVTVTASTSGSGTISQNTALTITITQ